MACSKRNLNGNKVGIPIKASLIYNKPTLKNIEANFERNDAERSRHKQRVMNAIDFALMKRSNQSLPALMKSLQKENIDTVLRQNSDGIIYGITYVDHKTRCVFNGSHLGKQYSANAIVQRCAGEKLQLSEAQSITDQHLVQRENKNSYAPGSFKMLDDLMRPENNVNANEPPEQQKFKKRKKRKLHQSQH